MSLQAFRADVVKTIDRDLKEAGIKLATVEKHGGRFTIDELRRCLVAVPGIRVAILGTPDSIDEANQPVVNVQWGAFIFTRDHPDFDRDEQILAIVSQLLVCLNGNRWGNEDAQGIPMDISSANLFSGKLDDEGCALWAIAWQQKVCLDAKVDVETLNAFTGLDVEWFLKGDLTPPDPENPEATDTINPDQT